MLCGVRGWHANPNKSHPCPQSAKTMMRMARREVPWPATEGGGLLPASTPPTQQGAGGSVAHDAVSQDWPTTR